MLSAALATWLTFQPNGPYLVSGRATYPSETQIWDLRSNRQVAQLYFGQDRCGRFTPDGLNLLLGATAGAVRTCTTLEIEKKFPRTGGPSPFGPVRVDPMTILVHGGHISTVWGIAGSPDGRWLATASHDRTVKLWNAQTRELVRSFIGHEELVWCVAFSPDSKYLASGADGIKVWEVASGRELHHFKSHRGLVVGLAFHPKQPWVFSSSSDLSLRVSDLACRKDLGMLHQSKHVVHNLASRPDGHWLAGAGDDRRVALWDCTKLPALPASPDRTLTGHAAPVWSVGFSPDGRYLASGSDQGVMILWDGQTFARKVTLRGGTKQIRCISFSRDGQLLSGAAYVAPTILWDLPALRRTLDEMNLDW